MMALTRGRLAKRVGCHSETIRYYEKVGLLPEPERAENGYRIYSEFHVQRLEFILRAKDLGFSGEVIGNLLRIASEGPEHTRAEVKSLAQRHLVEIEQKIAGLKELKASLLELSEHCDGADESAEDCPIILAMSGKPVNQGEPG